MRLIHQRIPGPISGVQTSGNTVTTRDSSLDYSAVLFLTIDPLGYTQILGANASEGSDFSTQFAVSEIEPYPYGSLSPDNIENWNLVSYPTN